MSEVWCVAPQCDKFTSKVSDQKVAFSSLHNRDRLSTKDVDAMFAANVQGLSNISLMSSKTASMSQKPSEYSLFNSDGLPPPVSNFVDASKSLNRSSSSDSFWPSSENCNRNRSFQLGFDLSDSDSSNTDASNLNARNDKEKIAAAIWGQFPESAPVAQSKAVGAEIRQQIVDGSSHAPRVVASGRQLMPTQVSGGVHAIRQQMAGPPIHIHQQLAIPAWPTSQGQLVTLLPAGSVQAGQPIFRAPLIQSRVINPALIPVAQGASIAPRAVDVGNVGTSASVSRSSYQPAHAVTATLTAPQLHSAIGQINELTIHALNQTAAMIMDRHQLESKLLHYAPEQFRSVYNELALPEPLEPIPGRKETSGVDMLLTSQLRENLRINTLIRRIKVVVQLTPSPVGTQALEKWTEDVRSFQAFLMKMHERARRLHLSSTIAATLYSTSDTSARANDSAALANMLNELMTSTLHARQALFQVGERALLLLSTASNLRKSVSPAHRDRGATSMDAQKATQNFHHQPIPVNPESAQQLWRQLGQPAPHGF